MSNRNLSKKREKCYTGDVIKGSKEWYYHYNEMWIKEFIKIRIAWFDRILGQYKVGKDSGTFHEQIIKDIKAERERLIEESGDKLI